MCITELECIYIGVAGIEGNGAEVNNAGEDSLKGRNRRICVDGDDETASLCLHLHHIVLILVGFTAECDFNHLRHPWRNGSLLIRLDREVRCRRRQHLHSLNHWRQVQHPHTRRLRFAQLVSRKLNLCRFKSDERVPSGRILG